MKLLKDRALVSWINRFWCGMAAAVAFYTCLPIAYNQALNFQYVARWATVVGFLIGGLLSLGDAGVQHLGMPVLTRSAIEIACWLALTGGLHLDGAMDTADGLAVPDASRRLQVMADSATGAFGAMAGFAVLLLKTSALADLDNHRWFAFMAAAGWGRWGQVVAIAFYPYLKPTGKGAFHKQAVRVPQDIILGLLLLLSLGGLQVFLNRQLLPMVLGMSAIGCLVAIFTGAWFYWKLGGHTGDTYGAVVEWTEAIFLCLFTFW